MPDFSDERGKLLELESRRRIYDIVRAHAGSHFREIERKSGLPPGNVKYHLSYLSRHGLIKEEKDGNNLRYFPNEIKSENKKLLGFLRQNTIRNIMLSLLINDNCNHEQIVRIVNLSPSTVSWHLKKLEESGMIESSREGRKTFYRLLVDKEEILRLLITYRESFLDSLVDRVIETWG